MPKVPTVKCLTSSFFLRMVVKRHFSLFDAAAWNEAFFVKFWRLIRVPGDSRF